MLTKQYTIHRGLEVIVNAPPARTSKKRKCLVVRVKNHLLSFPGIGNDEKQPAVTEAKVRHLHRLDDAGNHDLFMAQVKLVCFPRRKSQWDEYPAGGPSMLFPPLLQIALELSYAP